MREDKQNLEIVYSAMKSFYEETKDWKRSLSPKEIEERVNSTLRKDMLEAMKQFLEKHKANQLIALISSSEKNLVVCPEKSLPNELKSLMTDLSRQLKARENEDKSVCLKYFKEDNHAHRHMWKMDYCVMFRYLKSLKEEKRVIKKNNRGEYTIDFALQEDAKEQAAYPKALLIATNYRELTVNGQKIIPYYYPIGPIGKAPETESISNYVEKWRLQIHGKKDIAKAEANAWINSFIDTLSCEVRSGDGPLRIRTDELISTDKKDGLDAFIKRKAMEIMFELLESLDPELLKRLGDSGSLESTQMVVKISFNPATFVKRLKFQRDCKEIELNRKQVKSELSSRAYRVFEPDESLNKRVFKEIFANQPNDIDPLLFKVDQNR